MEFFIIFFALLTILFLYLTVLSFMFPRIINKLNQKFSKKYVQKTKRQLLLLNGIPFVVGLVLLIIALIFTDQDTLTQMTNDGSNNGDIDNLKITPKDEEKCVSGTKGDLLNIITEMQRIEKELYDIKAIKNVSKKAEANGFYQELTQKNIKKYNQLILESCCIDAKWEIQNALGTISTLAHSIAWNDKKMIEKRKILLSEQIKAALVDINKCNE